MKSLWETWEQTIVEVGDKPLILDLDGKWTSAWELRDQASALLASAGGSRNLAGRICAFSLPNGSEWLRVFLALQKADAIALALDASLPEPLQREEAVRAGASFFYRNGKFEQLDRRAPFRTPLCLSKLTSGSTGVAKALLFTHAEMLADGRNIVSSMGIRENDIHYGMVPFGHSYGLGNLIMPLLLQGTAIVAGGESLPRLVARHIAATGATVIPSVPAFFRALAHTEGAGKEMESVRLAISAGSPLHPDTAARYRAQFGRSIHNFYGSSETGGIAYDRTGESTLEGRSVGLPLDGVEVTTGPGSRLRVQSGAVCRYGRQGPSRGSWLLEDQGEINAAGEVVVIGRRRPLAKIGGRRVDPLEVEFHLRQIEGVSDALVVIEAGPGGDRLAAVLETELHLTSIKSQLAERLPAWKLPRRILAMEELPRNARGKINKEAVRQLLG